MTIDNAVSTLVATTLGISLEKVNDDLAYGAVPEWDSFSHVRLMLALEDAFSVTIDEEEMIELTTVRAIRRFVTD